MSNTLAISTVSAAFQRRLQAAAQAVVPAANVRLGAPTAKLAEDGAPLVNLHLYRVEPNPSHANAHLPSRGGAGERRTPSRLALNLHYIVTFYGNHDTYEPDQMLAEVLLSFEDEPELSKTTIANAISAESDLEDSDLDEALARLRVTRQMLSLDDFSKVWSILYQVPYAISLAFEVSHVVIETQDRAPVPVPVAQPALWVAPTSTLRLDAAGNAPGRIIPPVWGGVLHVTGEGLGKPGIALEVDGEPLVMNGVSVTANGLAIPLDAATFGAPLRVDVHRLQALAPPTPGQPAHLRARSNAIAFALSPAIAPGAVTAPGGGATAAGDMEVDFSPAIGSSQEVRLILDARPPLTAAQTVLPGRAPTDSGPDTTTLDFAFTDLARGPYLLRADVDGILSPVTTDTNAGSPSFGEIIGPEVVV